MSNVKVTRIQDAYGRTAYLYSYGNLELVIERHAFVDGWQLVTTGKRVDLPVNHWAYGEFTDCKSYLFGAPCKKHLVGIAKYYLTNGAEGEQCNAYASTC
jgi:hypothetical protein